MENKMRFDKWNIKYRIRAEGMGNERKYKIGYNEWEEIMFPMSRLWPGKSRSCT